MSAGPPNICNIAQSQEKIKNMNSEFYQQRGSLVSGNNIGVGGGMVQSPKSSLEFPDTFPETKMDQYLESINSNEKRASACKTQNLDQGINKKESPFKDIPDSIILSKTGEINFEKN